MVGNPDGWLLRVWHFFDLYKYSEAERIGATIIASREMSYFGTNGKTKDE